MACPEGYVVIHPVLLLGVPGELAAPLEISMVVTITASKQSNPVN